MKTWKFLGEKETPSLSLSYSTGSIHSWWFLKITDTSIMASEHEGVRNKNRAWGFSQGQKTQGTGQITEAQVTWASLNLLRKRWQCPFLHTLHDGCKAGNRLGLKASDTDPGEAVFFVIIWITKWHYILNPFFSQKSPDSLAEMTMNHKE